MRSSFARRVFIVLLFVVLSILVTFPTAARLSDFTVIATDSLLEAWTVKWDVHAILGGPQSLLHLWDANIIYPYPDTLAFSEHLLAHALLLMPIALLGGTPMTAANVGVLYTTFLSGLGMYLLVSWLVGDRRAGVIAGVAFAAGSYRMGHIIQLHLLSTHWMPFAFLAAARLIKFRRDSDLWLLIIFTNLQFLSSVNYIPVVGIGLAVWLGYLLVIHRSRVGWGMGVRLLAFVLATCALNWPILRVYQRIGELMGIARTLGDARVYGASLASYVTPITNSLLYARWLGLPDRPDSAFPGVVVIALALAGLVIVLLRPRRHARIVPLMICLIVTGLAGLLLSFGANEAALGEHLSPIVSRLLPYPYLFDLVPFLQGFRVPARFALLPTFGLAILAGIGFALLRRRFLVSNGYSLGITTLLVVFLLGEHLAAPLPGVSVPYGGAVYDWLAKTPKDAVAIELPYYLHTERSYRELDRVYQSARHWHNIVNGTSGFKPYWSVQIGRILDTFPDWRSFDLLRRMGVQYVVLHRNEYEVAAWDNVMGLLPGYMPSIAAMYSVGDDLILQMNPPVLNVAWSFIQVDAGAFPYLTISNQSPATFVANPRLPSLAVAGTQRRQFLEPLFVLPGQSTTFLVPLDLPLGADGWQVTLGNLGRAIRPERQPAAAAVGGQHDWQSVGLRFADGTVLKAVSVEEPGTVGGELKVIFQWLSAARAGAVASADLSDRFGRLVISNSSRSVPAPGGHTTSHVLPLAETVPPGRYELRARLLEADGSDLAPIGADGKLLDSAPGLPIVVRPGLPAVPLPAGQQPSTFANDVVLLGSSIDMRGISPGAWVRFTLYWRALNQLSADYTVFTQFIGPDGRVWAQRDNPPRAGWYPTSLWIPDELVVDDYALRLDPAAPSGSYQLIVGMYDSDTSVRVNISLGPGRDGDFVPVASILVPDQ